MINKGRRRVLDERPEAEAWPSSGSSGRSCHRVPWVGTGTVGGTGSARRPRLSRRGRGGGRCCCSGGPKSPRSPRTSSWGGRRSGKEWSDSQRRKGHLGKTYTAKIILNLSFTVFSSLKCSLLGELVRRGMCFFLDVTLLVQSFVLLLQDLVENCGDVRLGEHRLQDVTGDRGLGEEMENSESWSFTWRRSTRRCPRVGTQEQEEREGGGA